MSEIERASFVAFALALAGVALSIWWILASQPDTSDIRWWLVILPVVIAATPLALPDRGVRLAATLVLGAWCFVGGFSIGILLLPSLVTMVAAVVREA